jgi:hypothetical protein
MLISREARLLTCGCTEGAEASNWGFDDHIGPLIAWGWASSCPPPPTLPTCSYGSSCVQLIACAGLLGRSSLCCGVSIASAYSTLVPL